MWIRGFFTFGENLQLFIGDNSSNGWLRRPKDQIQNMTHVAEQEVSYLKFERITEKYKYRKQKITENTETKYMQLIKPDFNTVILARTRYKQYWRYNFPQCSSIENTGITTISPQAISTSLNFYHQISNWIPGGLRGGLVLRGWVGGCCRIKIESQTGMQTTGPTWSDLCLWSEIIAHVLAFA